MNRLFGTDGVRGIPGEGPLTPEGLRRLGLAAGRELLGGRRAKTNGSTPFVFIGRDTRASGSSMALDIAKGLAAAGIISVDLGILPTPAVSYLTSKRGALGGVVISASHNPPEFNGVKFFAADGSKLSVSAEKNMESALPGLRDPGSSFLSKMKYADRDGLDEYSDFLRSTFPATLDLCGVRIVLDAANGAAAGFASRLLRSLGAEVIDVGVSPNGRNINAGCGATATERMRREVIRRKADVGIALDGDADRAVFSDEKGRLLGGDALIALSALSLYEKGLLTGDRVVLTVMSNLGLRIFLDSRGISSSEVPVGDRHVTDAMKSEGAVLGGENSGHVIFRRFAPTGDGMLTALQTLAAWREVGGAVSRAGRIYEEYPQVLKNVRIEKRISLDKLKSFGRELRAAQKKMKGRGRVFVRYSGTEPLLRILVEGRSKSETVDTAQRLAKTFKNEVKKKIATGA